MILRCSGAAMKLDANAILHLLAKEYGDVVGWVPSRTQPVDFPMLYDDEAPADGHTLLVADYIMLEKEAPMENVVCVCVAEEAAQSARRAGYPTIYVRSVTLQNLYNHMLTTFMRHERFEAQLRAYVEAHAGFRPIMDACAQAMGCACALVDKEFRLVWQADGRRDAPKSDEPLLDADAIDLFTGSREYRRLRTSRRVYAAYPTVNLFMKNVFHEGTMVGSVVMAHDGDVQSARYARFLLEYLTPHIEDMYARRGSFGTASVGASRIRSLVAGALEGKAVDYAGLDHLLDEEGSGGPEGRNRFAVLRFVRSFTDDEGDYGYLIERIELTWARAYCAVVDKCLFVLLDLDNAGRGARAQEGLVGRSKPRTQREREAAYLQEVVVFARDSLAKVGMSRRFSSSTQIAAARMQASAALEQGELVDPTYWFYRFEDYALSWLLTHGQQGVPAEYISHPAIPILERYDRQNGSDLLGTLRAFMRCRYNVTKTAGELFVARSTLLNRLERIVELTGLNLDDATERLYVGVSFSLAR